MRKIVWILFAAFLAGCNGTPWQSGTSGETGRQMEDKEGPVAVVESAQQTVESIQQISQSAEKFTLSSRDFHNKGIIPSEFTCDGKNISPSLKWEGSPEGTKSFALTVKDPDAPGRTFVHWIVLNIPSKIDAIKKGVPVPDGAVELTNDFGDMSYGGPCPPSGTHRYIFTLYALNVAEIEAKASNADEVINKYVIAKTELTGLYKRKQ